MPISYPWLQMPNQMNIGPEQKYEGPDADYLQFLLNGAQTGQDINASGFDQSLGAPAMNFASMPTKEAQPISQPDLNKMNLTATRSVQAKSGPNLKSMMDELNNRELDSIRQQGLTVEALQKQLSDMGNKDMPINLQPIAALVDTWTGSKLAPYAAPIETKESRQKAMQQIQDKILMAQQGMTQSDIDLLKSKLSNQYQVENLEYKKEQDRAQNELDREKLGILKAKGTSGHILPSTAIQNYTTSQGAVNIASNLSDVIKSNAQIMGPVSGGILGKNPYDSERRELDAQFKLAKQSIGKMIEGGVLRKEDESKYDKILPSSSDLPDVALVKAQQMEAMLKSDISRYMENYGRAGYDVSGFATQTKNYKNDANKTEDSLSQDQRATNWAKDIQSGKVKATPEEMAMAQEILKLNRGQ